jgi:hypothetical protein
MLIHLSSLHINSYRKYWGCLVKAVGGHLGKRRTKATARVRRASLLEVWVLASLLGGNATSWIIDEHHFEEVESTIIEIVAEGCVLVSLPFGE